MARQGRAQQAQGRALSQSELRPMKLVLLVVFAFHAVLVSAQARTELPMVANVAASSPAPIVAMRLEDGEAPPLDATLAHPVWQRAPVFEAFVGKHPVYGVKPAHRSRVRVLFDAQAIYVGVEALDDAPEFIRRPLVRHDLVNRTQDFIVVYLDGMGRKQSAQFFRVSAAGSRGDGMHTHDDDFEDFAPDFDFDAVVAARADGWNALFRIPFTSLRYGPETPWRIMVGRRTPREQFHLSTSTPIPPDAPSFIANLQPLQGVRPPSDHALLVLRPSVTLRSARVREPGQAMRRDSEAEASLDLKWRPRAELVVDATLNPDFSQVALDVPQLSGNSAFALELQEKRPFFFESSDLLRAPTPSLYTRSITAPRAGLRGTWRSTSVSGTAFAIDDRGGGITLLPGAYGTAAVTQPGSRLLAGRVMADQPGGGVQWGGLWAARRYGDQRGDNIVVGPEVAWQISGPLRLRAQWLASETSAQDDGMGGLGKGPSRQGGMLNAKLVHQAGNRVYDLQVDDIGEHFRNDSGFIPQVGVTKFEAHAGHGWFGLGPLNELWFNLNVMGARAKANGEAVSYSLVPGVWMTGPHNLEWNLQLHGLDAVRARPGLAPLAQRFIYSELVFTPAEWFPLFESELTLGRLADMVSGNRTYPGAKLRLLNRLRPFERLEFEPSIWAARLQDGGRPVYREYAGQVLAVWHFSPQQTLRAIAQRQGLDRGAVRARARSNSLVYAWRQSAGTVLYVGATGAQDFSGRRDTEVFVKLQADIDELRRRF
jgi:Domain of unknown function (DUF5916)